MIGTERLPSAMLSKGTAFAHQRAKVAEAPVDSEKEEGAGGGTAKDSGRGEGQHQGVQREAGGDEATEYYDQKLQCVEAPTAEFRCAIG